MKPIWISLLVVIISALIASVIGTLAARVRYSAQRGLGLALDILFLLPLAIPAVVAYLTPIFIYSIIGLTPEAVPSMIVGMDMMWALPAFYLCAIWGFRKVAPGTIDAARIQGLGGCGIFWRVFFPPAWPWLLGGLMIGLSRGVFLALFTKATVHP